MPLYARGGALLHLLTNMLTPALLCVVFSVFSSAHARHHRACALPFKCTFTWLILCPVPNTPHACYVYTFDTLQCIFMIYSSRKVYSKRLRTSA